MSLVRAELTGVLTIYHNVTKISRAEWLAVGRVMLPADTHELLGPVNGTDQRNVADGKVKDSETWG